MHNFTITQNRGKYINNTLKSTFARLFIFYWVEPVS